MRAVTMRKVAAETKQKDDGASELVEQLKLKMTREQIFALKFKGVTLPDEEIFKSLQAYSPTGRPKRIPATAVNLFKYEKFLKSMKRYI